MYFSKITPISTLMQNEIGGSNRIILKFRTSFRRRRLHYQPSAVVVCARRTRTTGFMLRQVALIFRVAHAPAQTIRLFPCITQFHRLIFAQLLLSLLLFAIIALLLQRDRDLIVAYYRVVLASTRSNPFFFLHLSKI